jgi:hypothetical protein
MVRVSRPDTGDLGHLRQALAEHFDGSPLAAIGQEINAQLDILEKLSGWTGLAPQSQREFIRQCHSLLHVIPAATQISGRFWFDINMIRAISTEWTCPEPLLPGSILPRAASEWQYAGIHIPNFTPARMPRIDMIDFPRSNAAEGIDLLAYPWLYHELGHLLLALRGAAFVAAVAELLDKIVQQSAKQRLGKAPAVQRRSQDLQEKVERAWRPSPIHSDWSHEIAADIVALWSCGPAFLAAYDDSPEDKNPYFIDKVHPPYETRSIAIIEAAKRLGWGSHVDSLTERIDEWAETDNDERNDVFLALGNQELVYGVLTAALDVCNALNLPRCDCATLSDLRTSLASNQSPPFGRSLILASWLIYEQHDGDSALYHEWEAKLVNTLVQEVTP